MGVIMRETLECPYCEKYVEVEMNDEYYEDTEEYSCPECNKNFEVLAEPQIYYSTQGKADCLNGAEHKWKQQIGAPEIHFKGKYICEDCSASKSVAEELATKEEWDVYFDR